MKKIKLYKEGIALLFDSSRKAIPFNIILAILLSIDLYYAGAPLLFIGIWISSIMVLGLSRSVFCKRVINKGLQPNHFKKTLNLFTLLTFFMGVAWGACYLIFLPYIDNLHEFIIILVFGGMCAGAIASLSVYMPAYLAYILPMFIPVIAYNYFTLDIDRIILSTMFLLFIFMLVISAKINSKLLNENFRLSNDKERLIDELKVMSRTDSLTGLHNRRYFETSLPKVLNRIKRNKHSLTLILIDVDNFKQINDTLGHPSGDRLLIEFSFLLKKCFRRSVDSVFRLGGDEFSILLENQPMSEILELCENIKESFKTDIINKEKYLNGLLPKEHEVSLSIGLININFDYPSNTNKIISEADKALYQAKRQGKNQVVIMH